MSAVAMGNQKSVRRVVDPVLQRMLDAEVAWEMPTPKHGPKTSTNAYPGSSEKIEVLRQRYEDGCLLWHPDDLTFFKIQQRGDDE